MIGDAELVTKAVGQFIGNPSDERVAERLLLLISEGKQEWLMGHSTLDVTGDGEVAASAASSASVLPSVVIGTRPSRAFRFVTPNVAAPCAVKVAAASRLIVLMPLRIRTVRPAFTFAHDGLNNLSLGSQGGYRSASQLKE